MNKMIRIAALATMTLVGVANAHAGVSNLGDCYNKVISACNKGNHAESCSNHGMNECDKVFPTPMVLQPGLSFGIGGGTAPVQSNNNLKQIGMAATAR